MLSPKDAGVKNLIPHFIHDRYLEGRRHGTFEGGALFVDLSGFTRLTSTLMKQGKAGAERLSLILNQIFEPLVQLVYAQGGFIPYFAGDSFTALFPGTNGPEAAFAERQQKVLAERLVHTALLARARFTADEMRFDEFAFGIKTGMALGTVEWGIVGDERLAFYFRGPAIDGCARAQQYAGTSEIVVDASLHPLLADAYRLEALPAEGLFLLDSAQQPPAPAAPPSLPPLREDVLVRFVPEEVLRFDAQGEFRHVVPVAISFDGLDTHETLDRFVRVALRQMDAFGGYLKEVDFGDKGGVLFGLFGAPVTFENNVARALEYLLSLQEEWRDLQHALPALRTRAGVASGVAWAGLVGGQARAQYAAVGLRVNLAARLMTQAAWGEILTDEEVQKERHYKFRYQGDIAYKGFERGVPTYKLVGRSAVRAQRFSGPFVGREVELAELRMFFSQNLQQGRPAMAFVFGEAGAGKSRLTWELRSALQGRYNLAWFSCQTDQILRKPLNPFIFFLKNYFDQSPEHDRATNRKLFEQRFQALLNDCSAILHGHAEAIRREIVRTKPVYAALIGLDQEHPFWKNLDARGRYQNSLAALSSLFIAESLIQPIVIEVEDAHWLDAMSRDFLREFVPRMVGFPIAFLFTSRYLDNGARPEIVDRHLLERHRIDTLRIDLRLWDEQALARFARDQLGGPVSEALVATLQRATEGNPFYAEQMLEYFRETGQLVQQEGHWTIKDEQLALTSSIEAILMARIDRLSDMVRETVKAAAVIGREFELPVLEEVMKAHSALPAAATHQLREQVRHAEEGQIWQAVNELRYMFRHSLLREAAYGMQVKARLRKLHRLIAQAIEKIYADQLEERYLDLAFHYEQAGVTEKMQYYLRKAADHARRHYQNQTALAHYDKLLDSFRATNDLTGMAEALLAKGEVLELTGRWDEARQAYEEALQTARARHDDALIARAMDSLGHLLMLQGQYDAAHGWLVKAAARFEQLDDRIGIARTYGHLGNLFFRQGRYRDAERYFLRSIHMAEGQPHTPDMAAIVGNLGLTYMNLGQYDEAIPWLERQLDVCRKAGDKQGMAGLFTNLGIVRYEKGDY
ncbi:MAG: adenylate/guanylate cyclase domain-containing protein, partial [Bacteroidetes bacterium]